MAPILADFTHQIFESELRWAGRRMRPGVWADGVGRFHVPNDAFDTNWGNLNGRTIDRVVDPPYTTQQLQWKRFLCRGTPRARKGGSVVAFVRRKGNTYFLVHNVRRSGKVQQLHLARLGERPRITDDVVRTVSRNTPLLDLDWPRLREVGRAA